MNSNERTLGIVAHLLAFCGYVIPFGNIIGPLALYLVKKDESEFVRHHAVESLNFQLSVTIYFIVSGILVFLLVGIPLLIAVAFFDLVLIIVASVKASDGDYYTYPLCIRFVSSR